MDSEGHVAGTITGVPLDLSTSGDQIFAYQGPAPTPADDKGFIAAIQMNGNWDTGDIGTVESNLPNRLTNGVNAIAIVPERDNAYYSCSISGPMEPDQTRGAVNNSDNWVKDDDNSAVLPLNCVLRCCSDYTIDTIAGAEESPYCAGATLLLTVSGQLNGAADWVWYEGACGSGSLIGVGDSITYKLKADVNLYVRGEGGCSNINEDCASITLQIDDTPPVAGCQDITISLGQALLPSSINNGSSDNCSDLLFFPFS